VEFLAFRRLNLDGIGPDEIGDNYNDRLLTARFHKTGFL
jgi:hypothetical protein